MNRLHPNDYSAEKHQKTLHNQRFFDKLWVFLGAWCSG